MKLIYVIISIFHTILLCNLAGTPIPFAGKISKDGINLDGQIKFFFQIHDGQGKTLWKSGKHAEDLVSVTVRGGRYMVLLGGPGMEEIDGQLFLDHDQLYLNLRVDLGDGQGLQTLGPDERITSVPHALAADWAAKARRAEVADAVVKGSVTRSMLDREVLSDLNRTISSDMLSRSLQQKIDAPVSASRFDPALIYYLAPLLEPKATDKLSDRTVMQGDSLALLAPPASGRNLSYQWKKDGLSLLGKNSAQLVIPELNASRDSGTYTVIVSNDFGSFSQSFYLRVSELAATSVVASVQHALLLDRKGRLHGFGENKYGQIGSKIAATATPLQILEDPVDRVATGSESTLFTKKAGGVWGLGNLAYLHGQTREPVLVLDEPVQGLAVGHLNHFITKIDGSLWAFGKGNFGRLGDGNTTNRASLVKVMDGNITQVVAYWGHVAVVKEDGSLWTFGANSRGQIGNGTTENQLIPFRVETSDVLQVAVGVSFTAYVKRDGSLWFCGYAENGIFDQTDLLTPEKVVDRGVRQVATGRNHILYLDENGSVWGVGESNSGQLGIPGGFFKQPFKMIESGVAQVVAGHYFSMIRMLDGRVLTYGSNSHGQLGTGGPDPFAIGGVEVPKLKVTDAEASEKSSYFVDQAGNLWSAGDEDGEGRLGNGTDDDSSLLVRVVEEGVTSVRSTASHVLFTKTDGSLWGFGEGNSGTLGRGTDSDSDLPVKIHAGRVRSFSAGNQHSAFVLEDGSLWTMGVDWHGQRGDGNASYSRFPQLVVEGNVSTVASAEAHSLFIKKDGSVWAMGRNNKGQLGTGNYTNQKSPIKIMEANASAVTCGADFSFVLMQDGSLFAFGNNENFRIGLPDKINYRTPTKVLSSGVMAVAGGISHSLILMTDGSLLGTGRNADYRMGLYREGDFKLIPIAESGVVGISAGEKHSIYWKADGTAYLLGRDDLGQLGLGRILKSSSPIEVK